MNIKQRNRNNQKSCRVFHSSRTFGRRRHFLPKTMCCPTNWIRTLRRVKRRCCVAEAKRPSWIMQLTLSQRSSNLRDNLRCTVHNTIHLLQLNSFRWITANWVHVIQCVSNSWRFCSEFVCFVCLCVFAASAYRWLLCTWRTSCVRKRKLCSAEPRCSTSMLT